MDFDGFLHTGTEGSVTSFTDSVTRGGASIRKKKDLKDLRTYKGFNGLRKPLRALEGPRGPYEALEGLIRPLRALL